MKELGVVAILLSIEFFDVIVYTVSKAAMKKGMNDFVFVMYSNAFATCLLLPITFIFYRKRALPPLTYFIVGQLFINGFLSCSVQMLRFFGIGYGSPTLATAMSDLIPAFTFILAIVFSMEKLDWKANSTQAKSIGTLVSIAGALIITLYKGQAVIKNHPSNKLFPKKHVSSEQFDWTWIIRNYPAELVIVLTRGTLVAMLSIPPSLISVTDPKALRLGFDVNLIAIALQTIFGVSLRSIVHIWVMSKKGPLYVAMFKPIGIIFAVIMGIAFLGDSIYLGSVLGAAIVVIGFYAVIWGKSQEQAKEECEVYDNSESYSPVVPLLKNKRMEE
ncbi:Auxin-induced protein 5NG4 [Glycine soja]|uniref:WAT1-related protein n=1 Tax=Glycine soja TaxID=3848 RepID=A0A0B2SC04_GLYSO|nr:Auxin-induced protein 5NG4 [Glycine soja]